MKKNFIKIRESFENVKICNLKKLENKGITLIALVITIIILLILAGVSLSLVAGGDGIFKKATTATKNYSIGKAKEKIELEIANLRIDKKENGLRKEDFLKINNQAITIVDITEFPLQMYCENYKFEVDENFVVTYVEEFARRIKARNKWNLGIENQELVTYQGTPEYKGATEGVYLNNSVLASKENYILNDTYTIIIETKNIENNGCGFMIGTGEGGSVIGSRCLGISRWMTGVLYMANTGSGDEYTIVADSVNYPQEQWNISVIKYDGTEFSYFINGKKIGSSSSSSIKDSRLYIGGIHNSGTSSAGVYWGYGNGYYRNLAIYDEALSDEDLEDYSF